MSKTFTYTHLKDNQGKMVEKATMERPPYDELDYDRGTGSGRNLSDFWGQKQREYAKHIASLLTYPALGFSPSDNGKTFNEDQFEVRYQSRSATGDPVYGWHDCPESTYNNLQDKPHLRRIIAVPLSEKREEIERFKRPTDEQVIKAAILFNDGKVEPEKLSDMVGLCDFIIDRLYENGDITIPSSKEK